MIKENKNVTRDNIMSEAVYRCYKEMYANAQPPADYDELLKLAKEGKDDRNDPIYNHHYLSEKEFSEIIEKYLHAYGMEEEFTSDIEALERWLDDPVIDKYIERDGDNPGYRGYEHLPKLSELIGDEHAKIVMDYIDKCKHFYRFNRDEQQFRMAMCFGASPTCNKKTVIDYWKKQGVDLDIKERSDTDIYYRYYEGLEESDDEYQEVMDFENDTDN